MWVRLTLREAGCNVSRLGGGGELVGWGGGVTECGVDGCSC